MPSVPELNPQDVGTPVPVTPKCPRRHSRIYDYIVGGVENEWFYRASTYCDFLPGKLAQKCKARLNFCRNSIVVRTDIAGGEPSRWLPLGEGRTSGSDEPMERRADVLRAGEERVILGIGRAGHLQEKGVPIVLDLPAVGSHLQDHTGVPLTYQDPLSDSLPRPALESWCRRGCSTMSPASSRTTPRSSTRQVPLNSPDIEFVALANVTDADIPGEGISRRSSGPSLRTPCGPRCASPRGTSERSDRAGERERRADRPLHPGESAGQLPLHVDVPMGVKADGARPSVVNTELKVHGMRGLRVCGTSTFPDILGTHTMAAAAVVAEKCAQT
ncbi:hypothetical protein BD414DRAFT_576847 [Trametes punicea]|nr:hypothetical protein BD414DRAFT_576847 [Trametes punicea]